MADGIVVRKHLDLHGGNPARSLAVAAPAGPVRAALEALADEDLRQSLTRLTTVPAGPSQSPLTHATTQPAATQPSPVPSVPSPITIPTS